MSPFNKEIALTIIFGTILILFFSMTMVFLFFIFRKKSILFKQEKKLMKLTFDQTLLEAQLEIQEHTFNFISQEIHDNVGQVLSLAKVQVNMLGRSQILEHEMLGNLKENLDKALQDLRNIAKSLSSERIKSIDLYEATVIEAQRISSSCTMQTNCLLNGKEQKIDEQKKLILFRIIQESLQNCIKHADASAVNLIFDYNLQSLHLTIEDNGKGFDLSNNTNKKDGLGIQNITTRTHLMGGICKIGSKLGEGTRIEIDLPYK